MDQQSAGNLDVFEMVAKGELTSEEGARIIQGRQKKTLGRPGWIPRQVYEPIAALLSFGAFYFRGQRNGKG